MAIDFDGPSLLITLDSGVTEETVANVYSRWKDWVLDNAEFPPAFRVVGGDPLGGGLQAGINVFLRNDLGWRIKPPEEDIIIRLTGNLYAEDPETPAFVPTVGVFNTLVRLDLSANLLQVATGDVDPTSLANAVWNRPTSVGSAGTHGELMRKLVTIARFLGLKG